MNYKICEKCDSVICGVFNLNTLCRDCQTKKIKLQKDKEIRMAKYNKAVVKTIIIVALATVVPIMMKFIFFISWFGVSILVNALLVLAIYLLNRIQVVKDVGEYTGSYKKSIVGE